MGAHRGRAITPPLAPTGLQQLFHITYSSRYGLDLYPHCDNVALVESTFVPIDCTTMAESIDQSLHQSTRNRDAFQPASTNADPKTNCASDYYPSDTAESPKSYTDTYAAHGEEDFDRPGQAAYVPVPRRKPDCKAD